MADAGAHLVAAHAEFRAADQECLLEIVHINEMLEVRREQEVHMHAVLQQARELFDALH